MNLAGQYGEKKKRKKKVAIIIFFLSSGWEVYFLCLVILCQQLGN